MKCKILLIAIAVMILFLTPVNAASYPNESYYFGQSMDQTFGPWSTVNADFYCIDAGFSGRNTGIGNVQFTEFNAARSQISSRAINFGSTVTKSSAQTSIASIGIYCNGGSIDGQVYWSEPEWQINYTATPTSGLVPVNVVFTGYNVSTERGDVELNFGDGNTTTYTWTGTPRTTFNHIYSVAGIYSPILKTKVGRNNPQRTFTRSNYINAFEYVVNFTGYPLDGYSPLTVNFTINNNTQINGTGGSWEFGDGKIATTANTTSFINHIYESPGIYSVTLNYFNFSGVQKTISKPNYVLASTPSGFIVNLDVKSAISPNPLIQDATVSIRNTTSGIWRNTTAPTGLVYFSTTGPGYTYPLSQNQSITLCANKTGYSDACETFNIPYNNYKARLFLMPGSVVNATGTGTVVVNVISNKNKLTVSGMSVVMDTGQIGVTSRAGAVTLYNVTAGNRLVKVTDPDGAYQPTEKTFTLAAGDTELIVVEVVKEGELPIDSPISPTPTPTGTYDPNDPNSPVYGNYTTSEINQQGGAGVLGMLAQLIELWPLAVIGVFMKFMKSAFS